MTENRWYFIWDAFNIPNEKFSELSYFLSIFSSSPIFLPLFIRCFFFFIGIFYLYPKSVCKKNSFTLRGGIKFWTPAVKSPKNEKRWKIPAGNRNLCRFFYNDDKRRLLFSELSGESGLGFMTISHLSSFWLLWNNIKRFLRNMEVSENNVFNAENVFKPAQFWWNKFAFSVRVFEIFWQLFASGNDKFNIIQVHQPLIGWSFV